MSDKKLSDNLRKSRENMPVQWQMDEFINQAENLEAERDRLIKIISEAKAFGEKSEEPFYAMMEKLRID